MKNRVDIHMPPDWSFEKKAKFRAWLNDELSKDEERELLRLPVKHNSEEANARAERKL